MIAATPIHAVQVSPTHELRTASPVNEIAVDGGRAATLVGEWEHPERRSRRYYSITDQGREEYERLHGEVRPFLESIARSIEAIVREVYGR